MRSLRPVCGRCEEEIVGVVPLWVEGVPVCRNCAYSNFSARSDTGTNRFDAPLETGSKKDTPSRIHPGIAVFVLLAWIIISGLKAGEIVRAVEPERPIYKGAANLDPETEACISNLWNITALLQSETGQWPVIRCPATGKPYDLTYVRGDSIVNCPNPQMHGVKKIRVTRNSPVPEVQL